MVCVIGVYVVLPVDLGISPTGDCDAPLLLTLDVCHASSAAVTADEGTLFLNECTCNLTVENTPETQPLTCFLFRPFIIASVKDHPPETSPISS